MKNIDCKNCETLKCLILKSCKPKCLDFSNEQKECFLIKKNQIILHEGNFVAGMHFIQEGKVKVYKTGVNGKEQIVRLSSSGDILGHRGWNRKEMPISALALEDTKICFIETNHFGQLLKENHDLTYNLMLLYSDELYSSEVKSRNLAQLSVAEMIADTLLYMQRIFGIDNQGFIDVVLKRQEMADLSGTTKQQVSKYLSDFKSDGLILTEGKKIKTLSAERLRKVSFRAIDIS